MQCDMKKQGSSQHIGVLGCSDESGSHKYTCSTNKVTLNRCLCLLLIIDTKAFYICWIILVFIIDLTLATSWQISGTVFSQSCFLMQSWLLQCTGKRQVTTFQHTTFKYLSTSYVTRLDWIRLYSISLNAILC